jgi:hypothetical protein
MEIHGSQQQQQHASKFIKINFIVIWLLLLSLAIEMTIQQQQRPSNSKYNKQLRTKSSSVEKNLAVSDKLQAHIER